MNKSHHSPLLPLLLRHREGLVSRDFILDYFGDCSLVSKEEAITSKMIRPGKLYTDGGTTHVVTSSPNSATILTSEEIALPERFKLSFYDKFELKYGSIENYPGTQIETTLGVFLLNYTCLVVPFGAIIPYVNGSWDIGKIEDKISKLVIEKAITPQQVLKYIDCIYSLSSLNDLCVPALSEKAITSNPAVDARREVLFEKHKDQLHDPNVMMSIEDELIALDKKHLEGDVSNGFMIEGKNYNVQRKRMFLMLGLVESFGDDVKGFNFGKSNLNDGWKLDELDIISNDVRRGIYDRAKSTALGGAGSKDLGRNFQDSAIVEHDCGTKRGLPVTINKNNMRFFVHRNIVVGDKLTALTEENIQKYIGKTVSLRSPMYCNSRNGYCYTCMDTRFESVGIKLLNIHPIGITSTVLTLALKSMHGTKASLLNIDDISSIVV